MKITFNGAARVVTGSCYLVENEDSKILVDCGMFQGTEDITALNYKKFKFDPREIDAVLLTHSHIDHSGLIPKLVREGFKGPIWCTQATNALCHIMLRDSANVQRINYKKEGQPPLYSRVDVRRTLKMFKSIEYGKELQVTDSIKARFRDAGHILGAAIIEVFVNDNGTEKKIVFSGDMGQNDIPIVRDKEEIENADYLLVESTYGDRLHKNLDKKNQKLADVINYTYKKGGKLFIPSFAVERTQEIIYRIRELLEQGLIPQQDVFLDSPLAMRATEIFERYTKFHDKETRAIKKPFYFKGLKFVTSVNESKAINRMDNPLIVIAGSGMCTSGRIIHHLNNGIDDSKNTILFVGYQAEETLGRQIKEGAKRIDIFDRSLPVEADVFAMESLSGHADYKGLIRWIKKIKKKPKKIFVVHGEEDSALAFKEKLEKLGYDAKVPELHEEIVL